VIRFSATARDARGRTLEGLTPTWSFSPGHGQLDSDGAFVAYEAGSYVVSASFGARSADALVKVVERDVRRPVRVVARLPRTAFPTAEVWLHPNGKVAYLGTHGGGDRLYSIDISDPTHPTVVDSIQSNTRLVNDVMTTADGNYLVFTREGASDRRNGIVVADTHDPLHPKAVAEFTAGVTGGVHSAYVYTQPKYGTHVYLTNDADGCGAHRRHQRSGASEGSRDVEDPGLGQQRPVRSRRGRPRRHPLRRVVERRPRHARRGERHQGGSPSEPKLIAQYKYDLDKLYRDVEAVSGPGFTRGTHTAWRHGRYVFIADEVYRNGPVAGAKDAASSRMYGTLQVLDVSDIEHPKAVASYTPEYGGVHNVWVVGDTLYLGAYDGGFHVFDISGELRGDLRAQGREIAHLNTADLDGYVKNAAFTWGVVVNPKDGLAYVNDFNNGLWVVRVEARAGAVP
jgi:hypothetical protein